MDGAPWTALADPSFTFSESELVDMLNMYVTPEEQGTCRKRGVLCCTRAPSLPRRDLALEPPREPAARITASRAMALRRAPRLPRQPKFDLVTPTRF